MENNFEKIERFYKSNLLSEEKLLYQIEKSPHAEHAIILSLISDNAYNALYFQFIEKDLIKVKQAYYKCSRLIEYTIQKYNSRIIDTGGIEYMSYALVCDEVKLINRFADLRYNDLVRYMKGIESGHNTHHYLLKCLLKEDVEAFEHILTIAEAKFLKHFKNMKPNIEFFKAFINRDMEGINTAWAELLNPKRKRLDKYSTLEEKLIWTPIMTYAKLAWFKGIELEIDSPFVPKEWLPVQPLKDEEYVDYDFVKAYLG